MPSIKISIKYKYLTSKNDTLKRSATGMFKPDEVKAAQTAIWYRVRGAINATHCKPFTHDKAWVKIMVYRERDPNAGGVADIDPINFLPTIADAVKQAIRVDDDVFSSVVDWEVDAEDPRVEITIEQ